MGHDPVRYEVPRFRSRDARPAAGRPAARRPGGWVVFLFRPDVRSRRVPRTCPCVYTRRCSATTSARGAGAPARPWAARPPAPRPARGTGGSADRAAKRECSNAILIYVQMSVPSANAVSTMVYAPPPATSRGRPPAARRARTASSRRPCRAAHLAAWLSRVRVP